MRKYTILSLYSHRVQSVIKHNFKIRFFYFNFHPMFIFIFSTCLQKIKNMECRMCIYMYIHTRITILF